jgi:hypothetical protein
MADFATLSRPSSWDHNKCAPQQGYLSASSLAGLPTLITNFVYGCAVVKCWDETSSVDIMRKLAGAAYYDQRPQAPSSPSRQEITVVANRKRRS